jgi:hypothetical protein
MNIFTKIGNLVARTRTSYLFSACFVAGIICALGLITMGEYSGKSVQDFLISLAFFFWGLAGVPIFIRQDADFGAFHVEGVLAIIFGLVLIVGGFGFALLVFWMMLF